MSAVPGRLGPPSSRRLTDRPAVGKGQSRRPPGRTG